MIINCCVLLVTLALNTALVLEIYIYVGTVAKWFVL